MEFVAFRLSATQLTEIHNSVTNGVKHLKITRLGLVMALLARCLSEVEPESRPIDEISYVTNVRSFVDSPATRLTIYHSTADWVSTQSMRWSTPSFGSPRGCKSRKEPTFASP